MAASQLPQADSKPAQVKALPVPPSPIAQLSAVDRATIHGIFSGLHADATMRSLAEKRCAISPTLFPQVVSKLRRRLLAPDPSHLFSANTVAAMPLPLGAANDVKIAVSPLSSVRDAAVDTPSNPALAAAPQSFSVFLKLAADALSASSGNDASAASFANAPTSSSSSLPTPQQHPRAQFWSEHLLPLLERAAEESFGEALRSARIMRKSADLRAPHTWFPRARAFRRRIIFHAGPTNSGKTYHALNALKDATSGVYCGPLRLLALEVFETLNLDGVPTSLKTGQERRMMPFGRHVSCTFEMVDLATPVDVAVVDEVQMIGDPSRGFSWTRALLGLVAGEIHVCGDPAALPVVEALVGLCGDSLEVRRYERMTQLTPSKTSLGADYGRIEAGDCVVAFSRKDIYSIRRAIEKKTAHRCCVVYGSLPPETRSQQARLFNDAARSGYTVMVASDAIGMGLNLNIRRVIFHTMEKFDGERVGPIHPAHIKQIAGRAGRRSSAFPEGFATTLSDADLPYLHESLAAPPVPITHAGLFPSAEQLLRFSELLPPGTPFDALIDAFVTSSQMEGPYFMCRDDSIKMVAQILEPFKNFTLLQRASLSLAPVNLRNLNVKEYFLRYLREYDAGQVVRLNLQLPYADPSYLARDLEVLEAKILALDVYLWLGQRMGPLSFPDLTVANAMRLQAAALLEAALTTMSEETKSDWERSLGVKKAKRAAVAAAGGERGGGPSFYSSNQRGWGGGGALALCRLVTKRCNKNTVI